LGTVVLGLTAIILTLVGAFAYAIAAYFAAFKLHLAVTDELRVMFACLILLQVMSLIAGLYLFAQLSIRASTVRG
jgi:hypothetical protein